MKIYTPEEVYKTLKTREPEKWVDLALSEIDISELGAVRVRGRFVKGFPANPTGRPKKKKIEKAKSTNLTKEEIDKFGKDAKKALEHLLSTASSRHEVKEISKILISYQSPKLANVESRSFEQKTIEIKWANQGGDLIDLEPDQYEVQLEAAKQIEGGLNDTDDQEVVEAKEAKEEDCRSKGDKDDV